MDKIGSFDNPVWTIREVGAIWTLGIIIAIVAIYLLVLWGYEAAQDVRTFFKWIIGKFRKI
jgi:hypothetical protein